MKRNRKRDQDMSNRQSSMKKAEQKGSSVLGDEESFEHGVGESDLTRGMSSASEQGMESSGERSRATGITNRGMEREQDEQDRLPERGKSQSGR